MRSCFRFATALLMLAGCAAAESAGGLNLTGDGGRDVTLSLIDTGAPEGTPAMGAACSRDGECASGFCVDGVCCNSACAGSCLTCAAADNPGHCQPAAIATDPRNDCTDEGAASCGHDGLCDGTGSCRRYQAGTVCQPASCTGSMLTATGMCDGAGTCVVMPSQSCAPFACDVGAACRSSCVADSDCAAPSSCQGGTCGKKAPGTACAGSTECASGVCAQGVCCNVACDGICRSCALPVLRGTCSNIPTGQEALGMCAAPAVCGSGACGGLRGEYFRDQNLNTSVLVRTDAVVNFNWDQGSPDPSVPTDYFSARWTGTVTPRFSETYTFFTNADDGTRLWVNGQQLIDDWNVNAAHQKSGTIALTAGKAVSLKLEYFDQTMTAQVDLRWSSASETKAVIPTSALHP